MLASQFLRELHFIEACNPPPGSVNPCRRSQFLRELHFIEARRGCRGASPPGRRSSFGNCTSLRPLPHAGLLPVHVSQILRDCTSLRQVLVLSGNQALLSQFLRELHFIEAHPGSAQRQPAPWLQFLRELHFIEASRTVAASARGRGRSSFGGCTSLRLRVVTLNRGVVGVAVPSGTALH